MIMCPKGLQDTALTATGTCLTISSLILYSRMRSLKIALTNGFRTRGVGAGHTLNIDEYGNSDE